MSRTHVHEYTEVAGAGYCGDAAQFEAVLGLYERDLPGRLPPLLQRLAADYKSGEFAGVPLDYARVARQRGLAGAAATLLSASNRTEYRGIRIRGTLFRAALAPGYSGYATDNSGVMLQWTKRGVPQVLFTPSLRVHVANVFRSRTVAYCIYTDLMYSRERIDR